MIGNIKQQCLDDAGHYVWERKVLQLDVAAGVLRFTDQGSSSANPMELSLSGANLAKEWSFSSPIAGYGFDILWASGRINSFLVDDEDSCLAWVQAINTVIRGASDPGYQQRGEEQVQAHPLVSSPPRPPARSSHHHHHQQQSEQCDEFKEKEEDQLRMPPRPAPSSSAPPRGRYDPSASDDLVGGIATSEEALGSRSAYIDSMRHLFASTKQQLVSSSAEAPLPLPLPSLLQSSDLQLQAEQEQRIAALSKEVEVLRAKDQATAATFNRDLLRASNENSLFFDAAAQAAALQHKRELASLREELADERARGAAALDKEAALRRAAAASEEALRHLLQDKEDELLAAGIELRRHKDRADAEAKAWARERKKLVADYESTVAVLTQERDGGLDELRRQFAQRAAEIQSKFDSSLATMRADEAEALRARWEGDKARLLMEASKRAAKEVEVVRTAERKLAAQEIDNIRSAFQTREKQTADDLAELEKLHGLRLKQTQEELDKEKRCRLSCQNDLQAALLALERSKADVVHLSNDWQRKHNEQLMHADQLARDLASAQLQMQELRAAEASHRDAAKQAVAELRLLQAERGELKRQSSENGSSALQWRQLVAEQERSVSDAKTSARVATEEVQLLEHELRRLRQENHDLQTALQKAERLIFGVPQTQSQPQQQQQQPQPAARKSSAGTYSQLIEPRPTAPSVLPSSYSTPVHHQPGGSSHHAYPAGYYSQPITARKK